MIHHLSISGSPKHELSLGIIIPNTITRSLMRVEGQANVIASAVAASVAIFLDEEVDAFDADGAAACWEVEHIPTESEIRVSMSIAIKRRASR